MSKVTMPDPVATLWLQNGVTVNAFNRPPRLHDGDHRNEYFIKKGYTEEPLITTTQAEAYADAKALEALEEAAHICQSANNYDNPMTANDCSDAIRALIPKIIREALSGRRARP